MHTKGHKDPQNNMDYIACMNGSEGLDPTVISPRPAPPIHQPFEEKKGTYTGQEQTHKVYSIIYIKVLLGLVQRSSSNIYIYFSNF